MSLRYGDIVEYNNLRFMVLRANRRDYGGPGRNQTWRGVLIDHRRRDILGAVLTIGMSAQPKLVETTRAHMSLIFDPPLETDTRGEY